MQDKIPFHNINSLENMIINILEHGEKEIWDNIESQKNPLNRLKYRQFFKLALERIGK